MKINLLPDLVLQRRKDARLKQFATLGLAGWFGVLALVVLAVLAYRGFQDNQLKNAKKEFATLNAQVNSEENVEFRNRAMAVQNSLSTLSGLYSNQPRLSLVANALASLTPKTVTLKDLRITADGRMEFTGSATSYDEISNFISSLKANKSTAQAAQKNDTNGKPVAYFDSIVLGGANSLEKGVAFGLTAQYFPAYGGVK